MLGLEVNAGEGVSKTQKDLSAALEAQNPHLR
jgi:hypothetical protein